MSHSRVLRNAAGTNANDFSDSHADVRIFRYFVLCMCMEDDYSAGTLVFLHTNSYGSPIDIAALFSSPHHSDVLLSRCSPFAT